MVAKVLLVSVKGAPIVVFMKRSRSEKSSQSLTPSSSRPVQSLECVESRVECRYAEQFEEFVRIHIQLLALGTHGALGSEATACARPTKFKKI
jgi:hypothetical protein